MEKNNPPDTSRRNWLVAHALSVVFIIPAIAYVAVGYDATLLEYVSFIAASTASLLFATALSMGSLSHFIGWPDMRQGYQKQIGILAFWWSLLYAITLPLLYPELYWHGLPDYFYSADVLLGLTAMGIFTAMVLINSSFISPYVSRETIFFVLGLGYVGYALLAIRAIHIEFPLWHTWLITLEGLPPGRLILSLIALGVLSLRVLVAIDKHRHPPTKQKS